MFEVAAKWVAIIFAYEFEVQRMHAFRNLTFILWEYVYPQKGIQAYPEKIEYKVCWHNFCTNRIKELNSQMFE